jgi:hypothetical protein
MDITSRSITISSLYEVFFHYFKDMKEPHNQQIQNISENNKGDFNALEQYLSEGPPDEVFKQAQ